MIPDVPNGEVDRMIFVLASCNGNSHFIASKYDGDKGSTMCVNVNGNNVLLMETLVCVGSFRETHALLPGPVPQHKITVLLLTILEFAVGNVVDAIS